MSVLAVLLAALLLAVLVRFGARAHGLAAGVAAVLFVALSPRFFAHAFNNLKDVPEACLYAFAVLAGDRALGGAGWSDTWTARGSARAAAAALWLLAVAPGAVATARTHPNGICDYNVLVDATGLAEAERRLRALVPADAHVWVADAVWLHEGASLPP